MQSLSESERLAASIRNAAWMVRHYPRPSQRTQRAQAVQLLGLAVRAAFASSEDFEPLLIAILDGLRPFSEPAPF